jgi:DNA-binding NtrC family response regulator
VFLTRLSRTAELVTGLGERANIRILPAASLANAAAVITSAHTRVLMTETEFLDGTWEDALAFADRFSQPIRVVLIMRDFDGLLWVNALRRGVFDVVAQPYDPDRLEHVLVGALNSAGRFVPGS